LKSNNGSAEETEQEMFVIPVCFSNNCFPYISVTFLWKSGKLRT